MDALDRAAGLNDALAASADAARETIVAGAHDRERFREVLLSLPPASRDAWIDRVLGLSELPDDGPDLPRGCVPYLPCPVGAVMRAVELTQVDSSDVFVDVGSGLGRAAACAHLLTGAAVVGVEVQARLVAEARRLASSLGLSRVDFVEGDASAWPPPMAGGTVFFLYCPFGGERLDGLLRELEALARARPLRVCAVDLPLPARPWLTVAQGPADGVVTYRSV